MCLQIASREKVTSDGARSAGRYRQEETKMANEGRGFAGMDEEEQRRIASEGGQASGGNFANDPQRASEAGRKGAQAQPTEAMQEGGQHSHGNAQRGNG